MTLANGELSTPAGDAVRNKYRREGAEAERERIVKLLEAETGKLFEQGAGVGSYITAHLIALIKGENK